MADQCQPPPLGCWGHHHYLQHTQPHHPYRHCSPPLWALLPALPHTSSGCTHSWSLHLSHGVPPALVAACLVQSPRALRCETVQERSQNYTQGSANAAATRRGQTGNRHGLRRVCGVGVSHLHCVRNNSPVRRAQMGLSEAGAPSRWNGVCRWNAVGSHTVASDIDQFITVRVSVLLRAERGGRAATYSWAEVGLSFLSSVCCCAGIRSLVSLYTRTPAQCEP